jgi:hypothetical protein
VFEELSLGNGDRKQSAEGAVGCKSRGEFAVEEEVGLGRFNVWCEDFVCAAVQ